MSETAIVIPPRVAYSNPIRLTPSTRWRSRSAKLAIAAVHQVAEVGAAASRGRGSAAGPGSTWLKMMRPTGGDDPAVDQRAGRLVPGPHADLDRLVQSQGHGVVVDRRPWVVVRQRARGATAPPAIPPLESSNARRPPLRPRTGAGRAGSLAVALGHIRREVVAAQDHVWVGATIGLPSAGDSRFDVESSIVRASSWAAVESGTWTAIWSPSKSALNAVQTSG